MADKNITMTTAGGVRLETEGTYVDTDIVVAPDSTSQENLTSENIRDGVSILGVTGTLSAEAGADGKTPVLTQSTINFIPSTTQNGQFTIGAEVEVGDPIIIACTGSGTYDGRSWMVVGDVMSFASTSHVAVVDVTGVTETTGEQGPQGEQGATGSPGAAGADGEDGEPPVIATQDSYSGVPVTGTSQQYTLDTWSRVPASGDDIMIMVAGQAGTASADRTFISVGTVVSATSQSPNYAVTVNVVGVQETTGQGGAAGVGVPSGGTTGQVLKKASNTNYDTEWADESGGGGGSGDDYVVIEFSSTTPSETEQQQAYQTVMTAYNAGNNLTNLWISVPSSGIENKSHLSVIYESEAPLLAIGFQALSMGQNNTAFSIIQITFSNNAGSLDVVTYALSDFVSANSPAFRGTPTAPTPTSSSGATQIATKGYVDSKAGIQSNTASQSAFSTVSNIVTTTADSPDASSLPEGTLVIKIAS